MKSILLYANEDMGTGGRLDAALSLASLFDCRINCLQITPYDAFIMADPFGGIYALPTTVEQIGVVEDAHRARVEAELRRHQARWEWINFEGNPGHVLFEHSRLADIIVVSLPHGNGKDHALSLAADLAIHARGPVLAVPQTSQSLSWEGEAMIAWNGSHESAHALRFAVPLLVRASAVRIVTVTGGRIGMPASQAIDYLRQYGIEAKPQDCERGKGTVAHALLKAADKMRAHYIVAGAFGHSRLREAVVGGTTRDLIATSTIPLLLSH
ncbi:MAG TPA: universal stress protein [Allosphingosinicella sp.]|nr:universal stress protein [Allosphingosinicella sp.]